MATVTAPIMTDATGQSIDSKLNSLLGKMDNLAAAFQPNASGIVYSNTTSGLTGDDVQEAIDEMAADVSEIKSSLSDNKLGARIDISNYTTTQNLYVCPCDGFVGVDLTAAANAKCFVRIFGSDSVSNQISIGGWGNGTYGCYTCFVRKGMRLMTALVENNGKPFFIPITR